MIFGCMIEIVKDMGRQLKCLILMALVSASCVMTEYGKGICRTDADGETTQAEFMMMIKGEKEIAVTRSILSEGTIETKVTEITLASFDENGRLTDSRYYSGNMSPMELSISSKGLSNVYAVVNMGDVTHKIPDAESEMASLDYRLESYEAVEQRGIPMSGVLEGVSPDNSLRIVPVDRLFAKFCVRVLHSGLQNSSSGALFAYNMKNVSMFIRQANSSLSPFAEQGSRALSPSDMMDMSDHCLDMNSRTDYKGSLSQSQLGPGPGYFQDTTFVFYVPENIQGRLLSGNSDPFRKESSAISDVNGKDMSGLCTYLEFNAKRENTAQGYHGSVMYRYYLGEDEVSDFSITGNYRYDIVLDFTEEGFYVDSWKVTRGEDWQDTRVLEFLDSPYVIYNGGSCDVDVRYHRSAGASGSQNLPDEWTYVFDEERMRASGLVYEFMRPDTDVKDFRFSFSASENAEIGASFPLKIMTKDGYLVEETTISIADIGDMVPVWDFYPEYVSQYGTVTFADVAVDRLPLTVEVSDEDVVRIEPAGDDCFRIVALSPGETEAVFRNSDGSQTVRLQMNVKAPYMTLPDYDVSLSLDGTVRGVPYWYVDDSGRQLQHVDDEVFMEFLLPRLSDEGYFGIASERSSAEVYVACLEYDSDSIRTGVSYELELEAAGCPEVRHATMNVIVPDPFENVGYRHFGRIDDYTLLCTGSVDDGIKDKFKEMMSENSELHFDVSSPEADPSCVTASMSPAWAGVFSNRNEAFSLEYDVADGNISFSVAVNRLAGDEDHGAGRHDIVLEVSNMHSGETFAHVCGSVDVYVHALLGAYASFGVSRCDHSLSANGTTFARLYNSIAGYEIYAPVSTDYIHYIDVSLEWLHDVSGVLVFDRLTNSSTFDALNVVRPNVEDGFADPNTGLLYSVCKSSDERLSVGGEAPGVRAGIGRLLYRALRMQTYDYQVSESDRAYWFFGYLDATGRASQAFSPQFSIHDMNMGKDMDNNIVNSRSPYFFAPSSCPEYVDSAGAGYHVIHFLEEVEPHTGGWINLL